MYDVSRYMGGKRNQNPEDDNIFLNPIAKKRKVVYEPVPRVWPTRIRRPNPKYPNLYN